MTAIGVFDERSVHRHDGVKAAADRYITGFKEELESMTDHRKDK